MRTHMRLFVRIGLLCFASAFLAFHACADIALTTGVTYAGSIGLPGETNKFTFNGVPGQRLFFDALDADGLALNVTFISPGGVQLYQNRDDFDAGPWVLTEPGTYSLVFSGSGSTTGTYMFRLLDFSAAPPLTLGTVLSDQLSPPLACNIYQFNGKRGQRVALQNLAYSTNQAQWQLVGPANTVLSSGYIYQSLGTNTLPSDGEYCVMVIGTAPGLTPLTFQLLLSDVSDAAVASGGFGTVHSGTVSANQTNSFTYTASAGLPVYFNSLDRSGVSLVVDLVDPTGVPLPGFFSMAETVDIGPIVLPRSGTYTLNVRGGGASGNFSFRLLDLTTSPVLSLSGTVSNVLALPYQTDVYQLAGTAGQRLYYDSLLSSSVNVSFHLLGPDGQNPLSGTSFNDTGPGVLPYSGTYYLFQQTPLSTSPPYVFQMFDVGSQPALPLNTDISGTLGANTSLLYQLNGTNGEQVYFHGKGVTLSGATWSLYDGRNNQIASASLGGDFELTLPYSCDYVLVLANGQNAVGYTNQVNTFALATNNLTFGISLTNNIFNPGDQVVYTFGGTAGQRLYYDALIPGTPSIYMTLISPTGTQITSGYANYDVGPLALPETGTYTLQFNASGHNTGPISFQVLDLAAQPALPLNVDLTGTLPANYSKMFQLAGTSGEQLYFYAKSVSAGGASWGLYGPDNSSLGGAGLGADFPLTLAGAGTYALVISGGSNPVTYSNQVNTFAYTTNSLSLGATVTNNIFVPGDQVFYTFTGTAGQRLYYNPLAPSFASMNVTLISPTGVSLAGTGGNASDNFGPITLPQNGVYLLQFYANGHITGGFSFQLFDIAAQPALPLNTDLTGVLPAYNSLLYQLAGVSGEQLYFYSKAITGGGASWTLYGPNNENFNGAAFSQDFYQTLPYAGNYLLVLQSAANTVSYSNQVNTFSYVTNALSLGTEVTSAVVHPGDQLFYTFSGTAGQRLYFDSRQTNFINVQFTLLSPMDVSVASGNLPYDSPISFTLDQTGTYTLILSPAGHTTGAVAFNLLDLAAASPVTAGTTVTDSLSDGSQTKLYRFAGTMGQRINLQSSGMGGNQASWELINLTDQILGLNQNISQNIGTLTLPATCSYVIAVIGNSSVLSPVAYQWTLTDVSDSPVASSGFGTVNTGNVPANQTNSFLYKASAGLPVFFDSQDSSGVNLTVNLFSPDGTLVFSVSETSDAGPFVLPRSGTYTLNVQGNGGASGNFSFRLLDLTTSPTLALNAPLTGTLNNPYETDVYQFTSSVGQNLLYNALTNDVNYPSVYVQLLNPAWQGVGPGGDFQNSRGPFAMQFAGTSYLFMRNNHSVPSSFSVELLDVATQPALPIGTAQTNTLYPYPLEVYSYAGTAGQQLFFQGLSSNPGGTWTLFDPNNNPVSGGSTALPNNFEVTLPFSGTYALVLASSSSSSGPEVFQVNSFSYITNAYTLGTPLVDAITRPGERRVYTFNGTLGQRLVYNTLTNDPPSPNIITIQMLNPEGAQEGPFGGSRFSFNRGPFALQQSGTYTLVFDGGSASTGTFAFQLLDVSSQPVLPLNVSLTNTLNLLPELVYQYVGTAGQPLYFRGQSANPGGNWTLFDPNNNSVGSAGLVNDFSLILPLSGTYTLVLENSGLTPGTEVFAVNDYSYFTNAYTIDAPVVDAINRPGERKYYTFAGQTGQRLIYNALTNDPPSPNAIFVQLLSPQGVPESSVSGRFSNNQGPFALQESGTYTLVFYGSAASVGTFAFQLLDVAAQAALPLSTGVTNTLQVFPLEVYQFAGTPGQHLYFHGLATNPFGYWTLYDPNNFSVTGAGLINDFQAALTVAGTYVLVLGNNSTSLGTEVFEINPFNSVGQTPVFNQAPVLNLITNMTVGVGVPVTFVAQAGDPDGDSLSFSLDPGSPAGASINPSTGAFAWTPPVTGFSSQTPITVRVTDNGVPSLSAAQTFSVLVIAGPSMITVQYSAGLASPVWRSAPTKHYQLQFKNELIDPIWQPVGAVVTATDATTTQLDPGSSTNSHRFYRIQALP